MRPENFDNCERCDDLSVSPDTRRVESAQRRSARHRQGPDFTPVVQQEHPALHLQMARHSIVYCLYHNHNSLNPPIP